MPRLTLLGLSALVVSGCGGGPPAEYRFVGAVTACETLDWARTRHEMLEDGDTTGANRYAANRCFNVEPSRTVLAEESEGGFPGGLGRWVLVTTPGGQALEHLASAELRRTTGQEVRSRGWVLGDHLRVIE